MNKNFESYPTPEQIDAHGVDCVHPSTKKILANYRTYWAARDFCDSISDDNATKMRAYNEACRTRSDALHFNSFHDKKDWKYVPDMPKKPRLAAVPQLRWYKPGKAPIPADTATV